LGSILVAATDKGVCAISLRDEPNALVRDLHDKFPRAGRSAVILILSNWSRRPLASSAPKVRFDLPLEFGEPHSRIAYVADKDSGCPDGCPQHTGSLGDRPPRLSFDAVLYAVSVKPSRPNALPQQIEPPATEVAVLDGIFHNRRGGILRAAISSPALHRISGRSILRFAQSESSQHTNHL
jgi:hypothetical protein